MDKGTFLGNLDKVKDNINPELVSYLQSAPIETVEETIIDVLVNGEYNTSLDWLVSTFHETTETVGG